MKHDDKHTKVFKVADEFLKKMLQNGAVSIKVLDEKAQDQGISTKQLRSSKERLGIKTRRKGFQKNPHWDWYNPHIRDEDAQGAL